MHFIEVFEDHVAIQGPLEHIKTFSEIARYRISSGTMYDHVYF